MVQQTERIASKTYKAESTAKSIRKPFKHRIHSTVEERAFCPPPSPSPPQRQRAQVSAPSPAHTAPGTCTLPCTHTPTPTPCCSPATASRLCSPQEGHPLSVHCASESHESSTQEYSFKTGRGSCSEKYIQTNTDR